MKTNKIVTIVLALVSVACAIAALIFMDWKSTATHYAEHNTIKLYPVIMSAFMVLLLALTIKKKDKLVFLPLLGFMATSFYFVEKLYDGNNFNETVLDVLNPSENLSVLTMLLFFGFIAAVFISIIKDNKYSKIFVIAYLALLVASTIKFLPEITINKDLLPYTLTAYSMVLGYISLMVFFIPVDEKNNEVKNEENTQVEETETVDNKEE